MKGTVLVVTLIIFTLGFSAALYYFQVFAFYKEVNGLKSLEVFGRNIAVKNYRGIDSETSGLKLRGCFFVDPQEFSKLKKLTKATPLSAPFWFDCFNHKKIQQAIDSGKADAFLVAENEKDGIDRVVAVFPDGNAFQWRQLNSKYMD